MNLEAKSRKSERKRRKKDVTEKTKIDHGKCISKYQKKLKTKVEKSHQDPMRGFQVTISSPGETTHGILPKTLAEQLVNKGANGWKSTTEKENPSCQAGTTAMTCCSSSLQGLMPTSLKAVSAFNRGQWK